MPRIALVVNSTVSLPPELIRRYGMAQIPMQINFLDGNYEEGTDISVEEFYARLAQEEVIPNTSPPSPLRYQQLFEELLTTNDHILSIHASSALSQSYETALAATRVLGGQRITLHDTRSFAMGAGLQALTAARLIEQGAGIETILATLRRQREHTLAVFSPATLRFIRNSRRVGAFAVLVATLLNIKPVAQIRDGKLVILDRMRSWEAALERQIEEVVRFMDGAQPPELAVCHSNAYETAAAFAQQLQERFPETQTIISDVGPILAVHAGPGAVGVMTYKP